MKDKNSFIKNPYLPQHKVKGIIAGEGIKIFSEELFDMGISVFLSKRNINLDAPVMSHADLVCNYIGDGTFILDKSQAELSEKLMGQGARVIAVSGGLTAKYPADVKLNCVRIRGNLVCNKNTVCPEILNFADENGLNIVNVSQGYTKCSVAVVNKNAVITDDANIHKKLTANGFDSLLVNKGDVLLKGYNYGFIGGCCGLISKDVMLFAGELKSHRDCERINGFLRNYSVKATCLRCEKLIDIGSFIPVFEERD